MRNFTLQKTTLFFSLLLLAAVGFSQGSGFIVRPAALSASQAILDLGAPSGYTSLTTAGFNGDDVGNSKLPFKPLPSFSIEPFGDLRRGPDHRFTDFVPDDNNHGVYVYYDGTNFLFRMRLGSVVPGAKGYSILLDADGKFGATGASADPNYLAATSGINGNPGFEMEIDLLTQNSSNPGLAIYDVDGTNTPVLKKSYNNWLNYSQFSIAGTNDNGDPDVFLDFYVPLSDLTTLFGITASTSLRMGASTVMAPQPAVGGPKSDIYGLDDSQYKNTNAEWEAYINAQCSFSLSSLNNSSTSTICNICTSAPVVTAATAAVGTAQVQGTWTKSSLSGAANSATVYVYINGGTTAAGSTTVTSGSTWTVSGLTIASGDLITAKAQATNESMCLVSNTFKVTNCSNPSSRPVTPTMSCLTTSKGTGGTNKTTGWTIWTTNTTRNKSDNSVANAGNTGATFGAETGSTPNITWVYSSGCTGGSNMTSGSYRFWYTDANGCTSDPVIVCAAGNGPNALASSTTLIAPVVTSPSTFTIATKSVSGTASAGSTVNLYVNGILTGTTTATGSVSTSTTGTFTISGLTLSQSDVVSLTAEYNSGTVSTSYCGSKSATTYTVGCYTSPPVITTNAVTGYLTIGQPITGTSAEAAGATVKVYNSGNSLLATITVQSNGSWTTSGATFSNGFTGNAVVNTTYYATATNGTCASVASANASTASGVTSARCGSISTSSVDITTTAISGTLTGSVLAGTVVNLYEDGNFVGSYTTANNSWGPIDVTNKLYSGNGTSTGILTIGVQEASKEEVTCAATVAVTCSGPLTPSYTQQSSNGTSGTGATVPTGGTMTYTVTNLSPSTFYSVADATTGTAYASGVWTNGSTTSGSTITITTYPLTTAGSYNGVVKATSLTTTDMCSTLTAASSFSVLPVTLVEFKGAHGNGVNLLQWRTSTERGTIRFEIERSADGASFSKIGTVSATGGNSRYSFSDDKLVSASNYYRLRITDADGKAAYSQTLLLKSNGASMLLASVRPNPFVGEVAVSLQLAAAQKVTVSLLDVAGRKVAERQFTGAEGVNQFRFTGLSAIPKGLYVLKVYCGEAMFQEKLLKTE